MNFEPEDDRLDHSLRSKFEQFAPPPTGKVWPGIAPHIGPPPLPRRRRRPLPLPFLFGLTALLAGLAGWLLPHGTTGPAASVAMVGPSTKTKPTTAKSTLALAESSSTLAKLNPTLTKPSSTLTKPNPTLTKSNPTLAKPNPTLAKPNATLAKPNPILTKSTSTVPKPSFGLASLGSQTIEWHAKRPHRNFDLARLPLKTARPHSETRKPGLLLAIQKPQPPLLAHEARNITPGQPVTGSPVAAALGGAARSIVAAAPADSLPITIRPLAALERQTLVQLPGTATLAAGPLEAESRTRFIGTLRRERAELLRLQRRTDSLLLVLGDLPGTAPAIVAVAAPEADSTKKPAIKHRWSVLLTATPEQNTLNLQGPEDNPLTALRRNHETGRAGFSAAALAEYQLTPRLSVGGGVGYSTFGANLRITNKVTDIRVVYDSTTTRTTNVFTSINQTHSIRIVQVPQLSPIFNANGQVIRYDTVYVPRQDTVFSTIVQRDTVHTTRKVITPLISKKETLTTRQLQPTYRFFTVPVLLRYRLSLGPGRWWADVAAGAQLQFFLGGTQVVTDDGETFRTQTITAGSGPFRALNVALSGSLALNYALTNRLSLSVAPSLRWQALSVYKPETGLIQQPTATGLQLGVRFKL